MPNSKSTDSKAQKVVKRKPRFKGWRTTDEDEIERRRLRAAKEAFEIQPLEPREGFFGDYLVLSPSGGSYEVEIRSLDELTNSCDCPDFRVNRLGTCKHVEGVLAHLRQKPGAEAATRRGSRRVEIFLAHDDERSEARIAWPHRSHRRSRLRDLLEPFFSSTGSLLADPVDAVPALARKIEAAPPAVQKKVRLSRHLLAWAAEERRRAERQKARKAFLADAAAGKRSLDLLSLPLYPYQREGMLHLAFAERALLADEMGLGKTAQAIAACELLRQLRGVERVLVISPVSLKAEWQEQIRKFTALPAQIVSGPRGARLQLYRQESFFYLTNYEQIRSDGDDIQRLLAPDVIILDEAQRIKNWRTQTAAAVKRLTSRYAFVLTGTPLENRIDDVYSIVQFLDPGIFGPLFRFNRDFHQLDERGRPVGYKNLDELHRRLRPILLRRRKSEVEDQLPERTVNTFFVEMSPEQTVRYDEYAQRVASLLSKTKKRPLTPEEFERLQQWLACMRMLCDTPYILDPECRDCPKLEELEEILGDFLAEESHKILIFSEWTRMLDLVRELAEEMEIGFAWHTGSVPQDKRRGEIQRFKNDPACRLFLSTDSGSVGLNLQAANVVINLDQPWNPAKLEQRIARAWRKHQKRAVQVINMISEDTIEQRMLHVLAGKQLLAEGVLDGSGDLETMPLPSGREAFVKRLEEILGERVTEARSAIPGTAPPQVEAEAAAPEEHLRRELVARFDDRLLALERHGGESEEATILAVVDRDLDQEHRAQIEAIVDEHFAEASHRPRFELMDRTAWELVERLAEKGIVRFTAEAEILHRSPRLASTEARPRERTLEPARKSHGAGERKLRMAALLAGGGFLEEALPPLAEAVEHAMRCLLWLAGTEVPDDGEISATDFEARFRNEQPRLEKLAGELLTLERRLIELPDEVRDATDDDVQGCLGAGQRLFEEISAELHRMALGS